MKSGKKRFNLNKNVETSGHITSYGLPSPVPKSPSLPPLDLAPPQPRSYSPQKISREIQVEISEDSDKTEQLEDKSEEILKIKQEIQKKDEEIQEIKKFIKAANGDWEPFDRIEKIKWDKQIEAEKKALNRNVLEEQIIDKNKAKALQTLDKERDREERLKQLVQLRNDEIWQRQDSLNKANRYRQELNVQLGLQKQIHEIEQKLYWENIPRPKELPPPPSILQVGNVSPMSPEKITNSKPFLFSKKQPKKIVFNAITGELKDFSLFEQKSFSHLQKRNMSPPVRYY